MGFECMVNSQKEARRGAGQKGLRGSAFAPNSQLITGYKLRELDLRSGVPLHRKVSGQRSADWPTIIQVCNDDIDG